MQPETIEVEFALTPVDVRAFRRAHFANQWRSLLLWGALGVAVVFLLNILRDPIFYWLVNHGESYDSAEMLTDRIAPLVCVAIVGIGLFFRRVRLARKPRRGPTYQTQRLTMTQQGLHVARDGLVVEASWRAISEVRLRRGVTDLYLDKQQAYVIPARAFTTAGDFDTFNATVLAYFKAAHPDAP